VKRTGGIAGVAMRGELDTGELPAEQAAGVEAAVRDLAGHSPDGPPPPDGFRYEITPLDEHADLAPIVVDESHLPQPLKGAVAAAARGGELGG
jgi:hypothetical protein